MKSKRIIIVRAKYNGLDFSLMVKSNKPVCVFVANVPTKKSKSVKVYMQPDRNHERPHIHIGQHGASIAIDDGSLLAGDCDSSIYKLILEWLHFHRIDLQELWNLLKKGFSYEKLLQEIRMS